MKYRVKKVSYKNGRTEYIPQYKFLFWWIDDSAQTIGGSCELSYHSLHACKDYINKMYNPIIEKEIIYPNKSK